MTQKQTREYKQANQERKAFIVERALKSPPQERGWWARLGLIQNGKFTKHP